MLHQDNGKNLSSKETIVILQECPKILGSPETCGIQWVNQQHKCQLFLMSALTLEANVHVVDQETSDTKGLETNKKRKKARRK